MNTIDELQKQVETAMHDGDWEKVVAFRSQLNRLNSEHSEKEHKKWIESPDGVFVQWHSRWMVESLHTSLYDYSYTDLRAAFLAGLNSAESKE